MLSSEFDKSVTSSPHRELKHQDSKEIPLTHKPPIKPILDVRVFSVLQKKKNFKRKEFITDAPRFAMFRLMMVRY